MNKTLRNSTGMYFDTKLGKEVPYTGFVVNVELDSNELWECLKEDIGIDFAEKCPNANRVLCKCIAAARDQAPRDKDDE